MNIKKIEKQLKKINQLFETIKEDGTVSPIEKDLMLSYIRGLYEKMIETQSGSSNDGASSKVQKSKSKPEEPKAKEPFTSSNNIADVVMKEVIEEDHLISNSHTHTPPAESIATAPVQHKVVEQVVIETPKPQIPQDLIDLFKFDTINELSDKLSRSPISDLTKSMGINEKIFTVQELFGGDSFLFTKSMETMDKFSSLEQARDYLVEHVAIDQNWTDESKIKKAANFIKLVSRRY